MAEIKLAKLPERTPVKVTIAVSPDLHLALEEYSRVYAEIYEQAESVSELIPAMLATFLEGDRGFARRRGKQKG